jgi:hypothetical protein
VPHAFDLEAQTRYLGGSKNPASPALIVTADSAYGSLYLLAGRIIVGRIIGLAGSLRAAVRALLNPRP